MFSNLLKEYMLNASLHGAKFIADKTYPIKERIFWACCVFTAWFASGLLISASLDAFRKNAISFVVETAYRDWDTQFPAVIVCEVRNMDRVQKIADELWTENHEFTLEEGLGELAYFRGEAYHTVHECGGQLPNENCIFENFSYYAKMVRTKCPETIYDCDWNGNSFDCCTYFHYMETELGGCYALNSKQHQNKDAPSLNMISNRFTGPGTVVFHLATDAAVYVIGEEDVPMLVTPKIDYFTTSGSRSIHRTFILRNIENDPGARDVSVEQRNCRFSSDENNLDVYSYYSYSACSVQCRKDNQLKRCNCTSHLIPNTDEGLYCNLTGLKCLDEFYDELSVVIPEWATGRKGVVCNCLPSCTEVDISTVEIQNNNNENQGSHIKIRMSALPTERYRRNVVRGKLDLVVSMGGATGLFVGASILSFLEIFYYFTIRPLGNQFLRR